MTESARPKQGTRPQPITVAAAVLAVLLLVIVSALLVGGSGAIRGAAPGVGDSHLGAFALPTTTIDLNRSQTSGTYVAEYVTLNNSTTLTRLPVSLTVVAGSCRWVTVANFTAAASPTSPFHNVQYHNVTSGNDTGSLSDNGHGFRVCGGTGVWINYVYWTYSIYEFETTGLAVNGTVTLDGFSDWPGTTSAPANVSATVGPHTIARFTVSSNLTFTAVLPATVDGPNSCGVTGQICSYTQYSFVSAADSSNTSTSHSIAFTKASGLLVTGAYENWTAGYKNASVGDSTAIGGFFGETESAFQAIVVQYWYLWILGLLVVALVVAVSRRRRR